MASWRPEVFVEGQWSGNSLRFATYEEALHYVLDLADRWKLTKASRVLPDPEKAPTHRWHNGLVELDRKAG